MSDAGNDHENGAGDRQEEADRSSSSHTPKQERDDICRDFLKNICNRGNRCKFYHPADVPTTDESGQIHFCIDYQNRGCNRANCRFVHVPKDEAERYKQTREVTLPLARAIAAVTTGDTINGIPVCKEFQNGKCSRGAARCRYWHVNIDEERERRRRGLPPGGPMRGGGGGGPYPGYGGGPMMRRPPMDDYYDVGPKRARMDDQRVSELERRNAELAKEVEGLKRELQREHERYEDLYALFRQQTGSNAGPGGAGYSGGGWGSGAANWTS